MFYVLFLVYIVVTSAAFIATCLQSKQEDSFFVCAICMVAMLSPVSWVLWLADKIILALEDK